MLVKSVFMELRSRLRSCNVYITTGVDFSKDCNLKISIQTNAIVLNYYNASGHKRRDSLSSIESLSDVSDEESDNENTVIIPIEEFCHIIPNSMSCLNIDRNTVSFRILTESRDGGNFYAEYLTPSTAENNVVSNKSTINVTLNEELNIFCANCSNLIAGDIKFERILELPSTNLDMSEWFCHGHGNSTHNDGLQKQKNKDLLYRLTYFTVNSSILSEKTNKFNSKRDVYHCNRCLAWLGVKNKESIKIFNSDVKMNQNDVDKRIFSYKTSIESVSIGDFIFTIENMIKESSLGYQYMVTCRIILECHVSAANKQYLLIWVMDKELQVLKNRSQMKNDKVELESHCLTKVLYKFESSMNEEVEMWMGDPSVSSTEISKSMFCNGLEHLQKMSLKMPEAFRNTNGYFVSYLNV